MAGNIVKALKVIEKMRLKPLQKLELYKTYVFPHFLHELISSPPSLTTLRALDTEIRGAVKRIFHLTESVDDGLIHAQAKQGGLGVPRLSPISAD